MSELHDLAPVIDSDAAWRIFERVARQRRMRRRFLVALATIAVIAVGIAIVQIDTMESGRGRVQVVGQPTVPTAAISVSQSCAHHPTSHDQNSYSGLPDLHGQSIDYLRAHNTDAPIVDGHGNTIRYVALSVVKSGPDGTITLKRADGLVVLRGVGDFDGDGRSDLLVDTGPYNDTYIVPGTVPPGTYDPAVVGVRVPHPHLGPGQFLAFAATVGDQNGDGADDVSFGPALYSGRELVASHSDTVLPTSFRTLSSPYAGLLEVDPNAAPSFVVPDDITHAFHVLDHRLDQLVLDSNASDLSTAIATGASATGWLVNGHHIIEYGYSTRSGGTAWRWDLDAPCGT